jgi:hypothetical protein
MEQIKYKGKRELLHDSNLWRMHLVTSVIWHNLLTSSHVIATQKSNMTSAFP